MEKQGRFIIRRIWLLVGCALAMQSTASFALARTDEARITQTLGAVHLLGANDTPRPAAVGEAVAENETVRTEQSSRVEITGAGQTRARIGGQTRIAFRDNGRHLELSEGVALLYAPKWGGHIRAQASGVTTLLGNSTSVLELHGQSFKFLVLQGTARLFRPGHLGDSILVGPGQMVIGNPAASLSDPVDYDVARFVQTCQLLTDFGPLGSEKLIAKETEKQTRAKAKKRLIDTNLVIFGKGTMVTLTNSDSVPPPNDNNEQQAAAPAQTSTLPGAAMQLPRSNDKAATIPR